MFRAFGPRPRAYDVRLPRKVKALGIRSALSLAAKEERVVVIEDLSMEVPQTKTMAGLLDKLGAVDRKCLLVTADSDRAIYLSGRNIPKLRVTPATELSAYQLLDCETLIMTESALSKLQEVHE